MADTSSLFSPLSRRSVPISCSTASNSSTTERRKLGGADVRGKEEKRILDGMGAVPARQWPAEVSESNSACGQCDSKD